MSDDDRADEFTEADRRRMAARLIAHSMNDTRTDLEREVDHVNHLIAWHDAMIWIAVGALREWAELRGTTAEACLMDLLDSSGAPALVRLTSACQREARRWPDVAESDVASMRSHRHPPLDLHHPVAGWFKVPALAVQPRRSHLRHHHPRPRRSDVLSLELGHLHRGGETV